MSVRLSAVWFSATVAIVIDLLGTIVELVCQNILQVKIYSYEGLRWHNSKLFFY